MTWALCFNCGEIKFGAVLPCPQCEVTSTGDIELDILFSDHYFARETLEQFGDVVSIIHATSGDSALCFWAFMHYFSKNYPDILSVEWPPETLHRVEALLEGLQLPSVAIQRSEYQTIHRKPGARPTPTYAHDQLYASERQRLQDLVEDAMKARGEKSILHRTRFDPPQRQKPWWRFWR